MKESTKDLLLWFFAAALVILGFFFYAERENVKVFQSELAEQKAIAATGPCGTEGIVYGLGKDKDQAAVAGKLIPLEDAGRYYQEKYENMMVTKFQQGNQAVNGDPIIMKRPLLK
jgi:hypothetical protein